jgi:hypothetical protein
MSISLPDAVHADLLRVAAASNVSAAAVVRAVLSDLLPRMTGVLDYLGAVPPERVGSIRDELDLWSAELRTLMRTAPEALKPFQGLVEDDDEGGEG